MLTWTGFLLFTSLLFTSCNDSTGAGERVAGTTVVSSASKDTALKDSLYIPEPVGYVNDFESWFTIEQKRYLDSVIVDFEKRTTHEVAIVTLDSSWTTDENFEDYIFRLANHWGVGKDDKDNGIVIGLSHALRHIRIETGFGMEKLLPDTEVKAIIDRIILPHFKKGNYFQGVKEGLHAIMGRLQ